VPVDAVSFRRGVDPPWRRTSNGLASGNCLAEAIAHGLAEVIERDAMTLQALACDYAGTPHLLARLADAHRAPDPPPHPPPGFETAVPPAYPFVDLCSLPGPLAAAVERITAAGVRVDLRAMGSDVAVPAFLAPVDEPAGAGRAQTHVGYGCHPDAAVAARRAVTEAAQGRAGYIGGGREDLRVAAIRERAEPDGGWFSGRVDRVAFDAFPSQSAPDVVDDIRLMLDALRAAGLDEVVVVDLSHPDVPLPVVKVLVPGAEGPLDLWSARRGDFGWRARRLIAAMVAEAERSPRDGRSDRAGSLGPTVAGEA
jgi:ribosomal protein S12 methylthiotransferase accessory factor